MAVDRLPPQDIDTEVACLASALMSGDALSKITEILRPEDFYLERHRHIFSAITELTAKGMPVDLTTLKQKLSDKKLFEKIGGDTALVSIYQSVATSYNAESYAKRLKELSLRRRLIDVSLQSIDKCYNLVRDSDEVIDEIEQDIFAATERRIVSTYVPINDILNKTLGDIDIWYKSKKTVTGTPTGFLDLDEMLTGFHGSELIIIAARPGMGKTALALNMINNIAKQEPSKAILFFSIEMPGSQLGLRLLCLHASVDSQRVRTGHISEDERRSLFNAASALGQQKIFIDDTPSINIMEIRGKARRLAQKTDISLIVIDYLQLITSLSKTDRHLQVAEISRSLKQLARELNVPVIALAQLSRAVESRADQKPTLSDLRESGAIEQDADVVIFIYREEKVKMDTDRKGIADLIIAKQRNGPVGSVELSFLDRYTKFDNKAKNVDENLQPFGAV